MRLKSFLLPLALLTTHGVLAAPSAALDPKVQAYFEQHCLKCHDAEVQKGDFRIDNLSPKVGFENTPQWLEIMERINSGEMPPKKEKRRSTADESAQVVEWIAALWMVHWSDADGRLCRGQLVEVTNPQTRSKPGMSPPMFFQHGATWGRAIYLPNK
jgi:mono/diheme cytochrome c family protein